jgi:YVTN family beta-propeller protein
MLRRLAPLAVIALIAGLFTAPRFLVSHPTSGSDFVHFESSHVHPATLTPTGDRLLVVNTPDNRLSVFDVTAGLTRIAEIPVGLEPVAVAALSDSEAWVVNHLSDNVSIVNLNTMHVKASLRVGDEPSDVVFAGAVPRAYVSVSQEDCVKVYDPATRALVATIAINGRNPRTLAKSPDGSLVFAAVFQAGNRTSVLSAAEAADSIPDDFDFPRDPSNKLGHPAPDVGWIIQRQGNDWRDFYGKLWNAKVKYTMPDVDVAEIATATQTVNRAFSSLGSVNYSIGVSPADGRLAAVTTEARNLLPLEPRLAGYLVETQIMFVATSGVITPRILNPHIVYDFTPGPQAETDSALGIPTGVAFSSNGQRAYVTSFANNKLAVLNPNTGGSASMVLARVPTIAGPSGLVMDEARGRVYVVGRFRNQVQALSLTNLQSLEVANIGFDPTPDEIVNGRKFFYGGFTSGHGDQSCATCHTFGDMDNLAWNLGDPFAPYDPGTPPLDGFDPQKGPMTTQTMRGMTNTEPLHWRGDRVNLAAFNPAFVTLMGRADALPDSEMTAFSAFVMPMVHPPNPHQNLDRSYPDAPIGDASAKRGHTAFTTTSLEGPPMSMITCNNCHTATGFGPGTNRMMIPNEQLLSSQDMKVPQLRNLYRKTGFEDRVGAANRRGFGFGHDGAIDDLFTFLQGGQFTFDSDTSIANPLRRDIKAFLLAFDTGMAPAVGYQITFTGVPNPSGLQSLDTLKAQSDSAFCQLVARGRVNGVARSWMYMSNDSWRPDRNGEPEISTGTLLALADLGSEVTVTGVPFGSGNRMGLDRDRDLFFDGDEVAAGTDPGDPASRPGPTGVGPGAQRGRLERIGPNPFRDRAEVVLALPRAQRVDITVYDVLGREVRTLVPSRTLAAGEHRIMWDGRRGDGGATGAGVYFLRFRCEDGTTVRPLVRIR